VGESERASGRTLEVDGNIVHYHDVGAGEPLLMLQSFGPLPGTTAWFTFHRVIERLAAHRRCILVDNPNFGRSSAVEFHEPVHDLYVRNALAVLDEAGVDRADVVGTSTGGTVALDLALAAPERVARMVIGGCEASTGGDPYVLSAFPSEAARLFHECQSEPPARDRIHRFLVALVDDPAIIEEDLVERMFTWRVREPEHAAAWARSTSVAHSNIAQIRDITAPTLILHGAQDRMVPLEQALRLVSMLPSADLVVLGRCGHWPAIERPDAFVRHVSWFLEPGGGGLQDIEG
jgi:2-hydroxy-6-oxonona-2,4-dienedioate hydrolase